jgi:cytochrome c biogenesis protein CcmG, thiol:disulfide interchange protein DsbE
VKRSAVPITVAVLAVALIALLVYGVIGKKTDDSLDQAVAAGKKPAAPGLDVSLPNLSGGGSRSLAELRGKVVVLNFWASWCEPCKAEAPVLERVQQRLQHNGGTVFGVTYKDAPGDSLAFVRHEKATWPNVRDDRLKLPETFVIDRAGKVVAVSRGQIDQQFMDSALARAGVPE